MASILQTTDQQSINILCYRPYPLNIISVVSYLKYYYFGLCPSDRSVRANIAWSMQNHRYGFPRRHLLVSSVNRATGLPQPLAVRLDCRHRVCMRAYSVDLRQKIIEAVWRGMSKAEAARTFGVGSSSVKRYVNMARKGESLAPKKALARNASSIRGQRGHWRKTSTGVPRPPMGRGRDCS